MKKRLGFVSNSSSSSFVCCISGTEASGWDLGLTDAEMYECVNGHIFLEKYLKGSLNNVTKEDFLADYIKQLAKWKHLDEDRKIERIRRLEEELEELDDNKWKEERYEMLQEYEYRYQLPSRYCPVCNYNELVADDAYQYLIKKYNLTKEEVLKMMKEDQFYK